MKNVKELLIIYENEKAKEWFNPVIEYLSRYINITETFECRNLKRKYKVIYVKSSKEEVKL